MPPPDTFLEGQRLLITGGTGSLGQMLVRRLLAGEAGTPARIVVLSRDEAKQSEMRLAYSRSLVAGDEPLCERFSRSVRFQLGDVRSYADVCAALREVDVVVHAAAQKQVPGGEYFPDQAILTNCTGPMNIVRALREHAYPVHTVLGISTDKACKPVSAMGMSKALAERIFTAANLQCSATRFIGCRYGNVLASRGSVVPLFHEQIRAGGPVTVTVPEMTRFLMSLDDAVDCVLAALRTARAGEIFVPRVVSSTIYDLARALIGPRPIKIRFSGIRPGEKLHEILVSDEESGLTAKRGNYIAIQSMLPELHPTTDEAAPPLTKEYSSADGVIGLYETIEMLRFHRLLVDQPGDRARVESFQAPSAA